MNLKSFIKAFSYLSSYMVLTAMKQVLLDDNYFYVLDEKTKTKEVSPVVPGLGDYWHDRNDHNLRLRISSPLGFYHTTSLDWIGKFLSLLDTSPLDDKDLWTKYMVGTHHAHSPSLAFFWNQLVFLFVFFFLNEYPRYIILFKMLTFVEYFAYLLIFPC